MSERNGNLMGAKSAIPKEVLKQAAGPAPRREHGTGSAGPSVHQ